MRIALLLLLVSQISFANNVGEYWGPRLANKKIYQGFLGDTDAFDLNQYVGSDALAQLLGYQPGSLDATFRNGVPNPTNMMLWSLAMEKVAKDFGSVCHGNSDNVFAKQLREDVLADVLTLCSWPQAAAKDQELWDRVWFYGLAYDAPEAEALAWKNFFLNQYEVSTPEQLVSDALFAVFMNPHFLLRK